MGEPVQVTVGEDGLAVVRLDREHGNAINAELLAGLLGACDRAEQDAAVRGVLLAARGKLFSPGLDLRELIEFDRTAMAEFLELFSRCIKRLYEFPKPLVAAIHGHAVAGGCVLCLTADWRVLQRGALIGLNEVRVGVPFPYGVSMVLRESVPIAHVEEVALFGYNYSDEKAIAVGLAHELHDVEGFEEYCRGRLAELASRDPEAFAITKRYLRSPTAERLVRDADHRDDFLDRWFSEETRRKVAGIVADLRRP